MSKTWFSPYPPVMRGSQAALDKLTDLDKDINHLDLIISELKERRHRERDSEKQIVSGASGGLHSDYLSIVENQRRAESELFRMQEERLNLVLLADLAFKPFERGEYFPHPSVEEKAKAFIRMEKDRLLAVSTVAFFGAGITFSTIFSGTRGSIGLMSLSWAAFAIAFSVCIYVQWLSPENLPFSIVAYRNRRVVIVYVTLFAAFSAFVGIVLMGAAVAILNLNEGNNVTQVQTKINTSWGGIISLLPVVLGFVYGMATILVEGIRTSRIYVQRYRNGTLDSPSVGVA